MEIFIQKYKSKKLGLVGRFCPAYYTVPHPLLLLLPFLLLAPKAVVLPQLVVQGVQLLMKGEEENEG